MTGMRWQNQRVFNIRRFYMTPHRAKGVPKNGSLGWDYFNGFFLAFLLLTRTILFALGL